MTEFTPHAVYCQSCGAHIGNLTSHNGRVYLRIGAIVMTAADGWCDRCDTPWHWNASEKLLEDIIAKEIRRKNNSLLTPY